MFAWDKKKIELDIVSKLQHSAKADSLCNLAQKLLNVPLSVPFV